MENIYSVEKAPVIRKNKKNKNQNQSWLILISPNTSLESYENIVNEIKMVVI